MLQPNTFIDQAVMDDSFQLFHDGKPLVEDEN